MANTWTDHGSFLANPELSSEMRLQAAAKYVYRPHCRPVGGFGAKKGESVNFDKSQLINTVAPTPATEETWNEEDIALYKDSVTVELYNRRIKFTDKMDVLSKFDLTNETQRLLFDDQMRKIDALVAAQYQSAKFKYVATGASTFSFTENGTPGAAAAAQLSTTHLKNILEILKKRHVPKNGSFYNGILSIAASRAIYDDLESIAQYADPAFRLSAEIGKYIDIVMQEDANVLSNNLASLGFGEALFFGDDSCVEAIAMPEEMRVFEAPGGLTKYAGWVAVLGHKKTWDVVTDDVRGLGAGNAHGLERILHVSSNI